MNQASEIIVYRSPAEKAFWDLMSNASIWPIIVGSVVGIITVLVTQSLINWIGRNVKNKNVTFFLRSQSGNIALVLGAIVGFSVARWMWI